MGAVIRSQPGLPAPSLIDWSGGDTPFGAASVVYCMRGSTAILAALDCLGLRTGDVVLFPSYHCGTELDALRLHGVEPRFYPVDEGLRIDFDALNDLVDGRVRALYLIHYFGVPGPLQEASEFCRAHGLRLLEDCAQALYSRIGNTLLGTAGDVAIFSLRKTLGLPDGGAVMLNLADPDVIPTMASGQPIRRILRRILRLQLQKLDPRRPADLHATGPLETHETERDGGVPRVLQVPSEWRNVAISPVSLWLFQHTIHAEVIKRRRRNFELLLDAARPVPRLTPLISSLPEGACPLLFPMISAGDQTELVHFLRRRSIAADPHWPYFHPAFPAGDFTAAASMKRRVIALPVHQDLSSRALSRIARALEEWGNKQASTTQGDHLSCPSA